EFDIETCGVRRARGLVRKSEAEQVKGVNAKVARQLVEVSPPHETGSARADAMNENNRHAIILFARDLVEDVAMLPLEGMCFAAERPIIRLMRVTPDARIDSRERRHASRARAHCLPKLSHRVSSSKFKVQSCNPKFLLGTWNFEL